MGLRWHIQADAALPTSLPSLIQTKPSALGMQREMLYIRAHVHHSPQQLVFSQTTAWTMGRFQRFSNPDCAYWGQNHFDMDLHKINSQSPLSRFCYVLPQ